MSNETILAPAIVPAAQLPRLGWQHAAPVVASSEFLLIVGLGIVAGVDYSLLRYSAPGLVDSHASLGFITALLFVIVSWLRGDYQFGNYASVSLQFRPVFRSWNIAYLALFGTLFALKSGHDVSRGAAVALYVVGLGGLVWLRWALARAANGLSKSGRLSARRVFVVGAEADLRRFGERFQPWNDGFAVVGAATIGGLEGQPADLDGMLQRVVASARAARPDDVLLVLPWSDEALIDRVTEAFRLLPAAVELVPPQILEHFQTLALVRTGRVRSIVVTPRPLTHAQRLMKRAVDVVVGTAALLLASPLLIAVAIAIRLDSSGPVLYRQSRYGFNQKPFSIYKFRSMTVSESGERFTQARRDDARVTSVGRFLRRSSLDELPQLLNVIRGEMSLVGPRPHAVAQNRDFEHRIALYARRHNVKPGITGWAQVHGLRGETDTDEKMRQRVAHDLYYLDNWSLLLDFRIIAMTVLSARAFENAV